MFVESVARWQQQRVNHLQEIVEQQWTAQRREGRGWPSLSVRTLAVVSLMLQQHPFLLPLGNSLWILWVQF